MEKDSESESENSKNKRRKRKRRARSGKTRERSGHLRTHVGGQLKSAEDSTEKVKREDCQESLGRWMADINWRD